MILPILYTLKGKLLTGIVAIFTPLALTETFKGQLVIALIAVIPPTGAVIVALVALKRGQAQMKIALDGKLDVLMDAKVAAGKAAGKEEERVEARARQGADALAQQVVPTPTSQPPEHHE